MACERGHVWTPLWPRWEPIDDTPCDCGVVSFGEYSRQQLRDVAAACAPAAVPSATRWRIARVWGHCSQCPSRIGPGEKFRYVTPADRPACIACAKRLTGEDPPDHVAEIRYRDRLKPPPTDVDVDAEPILTGPSQPTVHRFTPPAPVDVAMRRLGERE